MDELVPQKRGLVLRGGWGRGFTAEQPGGKVLGDSARSPLEAEEDSGRLPLEQG